MVASVGEPVFVFIFVVRIAPTTVAPIRDVIIIRVLPVVESGADIFTVRDAVAVLIFDIDVIRQGSGVFHAELRGRRDIDLERGFPSAVAGGCQGGGEPALEARRPDSFAVLAEKFSGHYVRFLGMIHLEMDVDEHATQLCCDFRLIRVTLNLAFEVLGQIVKHRVAPFGLLRSQRSPE